MMVMFGERKCGSASRTVVIQGKWRKQRNGNSNVNKLKNVDSSIEEGDTLNPQTSHLASVLRLRCNNDDNDILDFEEIDIFTQHF